MQSTKLPNLSTRINTHLRKKPDDKHLNDRKDKMAIQIRIAKNVKRAFYIANHVPPFRAGRVYLPNHLR